MHNPIEHGVSQRAFSNFAMLAWISLILAFAGFFRLDFNHLLTEEELRIVVCSNQRHQTACYFISVRCKNRSNIVDIPRKQ